MTRSGPGFTTALTAGALWIGLIPIVNVQSPLRIGMSLSQSGLYAAPGQNQLRGRQLCVKPEKIPDCARDLAGTSRPQDRAGHEP